MHENDQERPFTDALVNLIHPVQCLRIPRRSLSRVVRSISQPMGTVVIRDAAFADNFTNCRTTRRSTTCCRPR